jgi:hypothetical protein
MAITSFEAAEPHMVGGTLGAADSPPQHRFRDILSFRRICRHAKHTETGNH